MPENGENKPLGDEGQDSPDEYERLRKGADQLRETSLSDQSSKAVRRRQMQGGLHTYMRYTGVGIQFMLLMLLPLGVGYWLDEWVGTSPWLLVAGALAGAIGGMIWVVYAVQKMEARSED